MVTTDKTKIKATKARFAKKHPNYMRDWYEAHPDYDNQRETRHDPMYNTSPLTRAKLRLGGVCQHRNVWGMYDCEVCDEEMLEIDHIVPARRKNNEGHQCLKTAHEVLSMENPQTKFQVLCANHHRVKTRRDIKKMRAGV